MGFAAAAPVIGSVVSGLFGRRSAKKQNEMQMAMAREQMDFQERMSSTAHQREVKDLLAAGLNPILSGTGGAGSSSPSGAMAPIVGEGEMPGLGQAASSAVQAMNLRQELKNARRTEELLVEQRRKTANEADIAAKDVELKRIAQSVAAQNSAAQAEAQTRLLQSQVPAAEAFEKLWKDLGEGGEIAKALGAGAPVVRMLLPFLLGGKR